MRKIRVQDIYSRRKNISDRDNVYKYLEIHVENYRKEEEAF